MAEKHTEAEFTQPEVTQPEAVVFNEENILSSDDLDGIRNERRIHLKRSRGGFLASVTIKRNEIDKLLFDPCNIELVRSELDRFATLFNNFCEAHNLFHAQLHDDAEIDLSEQYFQEIKESVSFFVQKVQDWVEISSAKLKSSEVMPGDSISQVSKNRSDRGSRTSSRASSLSSARAKQVMKRAEIQIELDAQKQRQWLETEELRLRLEKEELNLKIELKKANAMERALQDLEEENAQRIEFKESTPFEVLYGTSPLNPRASSWHQPFDLKPFPLQPVEKMPPCAIITTPPAVKPEDKFAPHATMKPSTAIPTVTSRVGSLPDHNAEIMSRQNDIMKEIISQQQRATLPKRHIPTFGGNPLEYCTFIRAFEAGIEIKEPDCTSRLYYLEQYTSGRAKELVRSCQHMDPQEGYKRARELLIEKFGQKHKLATAYIDRIISVEPLKAEDVEGLENFSILLASCKNSLKAIGYLSKVENPDAMKRIVEKLPYRLQERWRDIADDIMNVKNRDVTIEDISTFVDKKVRALTNPVFGKMSSTSKDKFSSSDIKSSRPGGNLNFVAKAEDVSKRQLNASTCLVCDGDHKLQDCVRFKEKSVKERFSAVRDLRLCFGCLRRGHTSKTCFQKKPCSECDRKHSTLLHSNAEVDYPKIKEKSEDSQANVVCGLVNTNEQFCGLTGAGRDVAVLPVVPVKVRCKKTSVCFETYALLDSGSNSTFCTESLVERLGVESMGVKIKLTTLGKHEEVNCSLVQDLEVSDLDENMFIQLPEVFTRPDIPVANEEIPSQEDIESWPYLHAQVHLQKLNSNVDLLIGVNVPEALEPKQVIGSKDGGPYAIKGLLGWTINGPTGRKLNNQSNFFVKTDAHPMCSSCTDFVDAFEDSKPSLSKEDMNFLDIVEGSLIQNEDHHYETALPIKDAEKNFPSNRIQAERRLAYLKRRFLKEPKFQEDYVGFIEGMIRNGHAEKIPMGSVCEDKTWYLPHHGVYHPKKPDKLRVVFDCAAKFQGTSLNERLLQGPDLTNSLIGVLTRFRQEPVAMMADVESMFYQVRVKEKDRSLLRFLWWPGGNLDTNLEEYQMSVHIFGATSSPSCANFVMRKHAESVKDTFGEDVVNTVLKNFYVDDCLKSLSTTEAAIQHAMDLSRLMKLGGFNLTKWISNDRSVLESIPESDRAKEVKNLDLKCDELPVERALGVGWCMESDTFKFKTVVKDRPTTRRGILSVTSSIYDPLGMVVPVVLPAKILLQDLCRLGLDWDKDIPDELQMKWRKWLDELPKLDQFSVNRCMKPSDFGNVVTCQIHHFADASQSAYGSVSYLRLVNESGRIHCALLMSKSRLAPLRQMTIPRLELAAAAVSVRVHKILKLELEMPIDEVRFWTDSMTVLRYLEQNTKRFHTYVANRVAYIRNDTLPNQWGYVDTKSNPADDVSRGMSCKAFLSCERWVNGPDFLWKPECDWPKRPDVGTLPKDDPEVKQHVTTLKAKVEANDLGELLNIFQRFSSWIRLKKFVVLCIRLQRRFCKKSTSTLGERSSENVHLVSVAEMEEAEREILNVVQHAAYKEEINTLKNGCALKSSSSLIKLDPVVIDGFLCVGGRLTRAPIPDSCKHQVIIPKNSHIAKLIVWHFHLKSGHSGREHVLSLVRERFWLIHAHSTVRQMLHDCFDCRRRQAPVLQQKMADLPLNRVSPGLPPFTYVGVDYFGPFFVKQKRSMVKRYGVIFTCLVVRAVHIEVAHSLETDSFIQALRRFIARRGQVKQMRSDNGTNFVGGNTELRSAIKEWDQHKIHTLLLQENIVWQFNPPSGSHHGGVWERCIRTIRKVLGALLKEQTLTDESLITLMAEVEAVINSRPLTTVSSDPKDLEPLTPNHLLQLRQGCSLPPGLFSESDLYSRKRWRQVQYLADIFWKRWIREYLPLLQQRQKWNNIQRNIKVGDVVLVVDESTPRCRWQIGRISVVYPDSKGFVRRVTVVTSTTTLVRPITKLCLLEEVESGAQPWSDNSES